MSSILNIQSLGLKYGFTNEEIDIILRSHDNLSKALSENRNVDGSEFFLHTLAHSSSSAEEINTRMNRIIFCILPQQFSQRLWKKHFLDSFLPYDTDKSLHHFISKLAECGGRSGSEKSLSILFDCCCSDDDSSDVVVDAYSLIRLCYLLTVASRVLLLPLCDIGDSYALIRMEEGFHIRQLGDFFLKYSKKNHTNDQVNSISKDQFLEIAGRYTPMLYHTLSTFVDTLIFHGKESSEEKIKIFQVPNFHDCSEILECTSSAGFLLGCLAPEAHGDNGYVRTLRFRGEEYLHY